MFILVMLKITAFTGDDAGYSALMQNTSVIEGKQRQIH
jgi:hypothetical protein